MTRTLVIHQAALGDFILTWPTLAALTASPSAQVKDSISVASPWSMAQLAGTYLPSVEPISIEQPLFTQLYGAAPPPTEIPDALRRFDRVVSYVSQSSSPWAHSAAQTWPDAAIYFVTPRPPGNWTEHVTRWHRHQLVQQGLTLVAEDRGSFLIGHPSPDGQANHRKQNDAVAVDIDVVDAVADRSMPRQLLVHLGSGAMGKLVDMVTLSDAVLQVESQFDRVQIIAGHAEQERGITDQWHNTKAGRKWGASVIDSLEDLGRTIEQASVYLGHDTGPTHLASVLGVPTVAMFGPTDPRVWRPLGKRMHVLAPAKPCAMTWIKPRMIAEAVLGMATGTPTAP